MSDKRETPLPCPFCGSGAEMIVSLIPVKRWVVQCGGTWCGATGPDRKTPAGALKAWDRRAK